MTTARTLAEITDDTRTVPCPHEHCGAEPLEACWPGPGVHVVRYAAAYRHGAIAESEFMSVLDAMDAFTNLASFGRVA